MEVKLRDNERIDDLEFKNLKIIQNEEGFCFGIDAVLLSDFAKKIKKGAKVLDLGTGTGIISILLCGKTKLKEIIGVEVQEEVYKMATRSAKLNDLEDKFKLINENIKDLDKIYENGTFDAIVTNPPYKKKDSGIENENEKKLISRHEILATLEDFIKISSKMLKDKGEFYIIHRPERMVDLFELMRKHKIEPKEVQMVFSKENVAPKMILVKGVKNGKSYLKFKENIYVYNEDNTYTDQILKIYGKI